MQNALVAPHPDVICAFSNPTSPGWIYLETMEFKSALDFCADKIQQIRDKLLCRPSEALQSRQGQRAQVKIGMYKQEIGQIVETEHNSDLGTLKVVPRRESRRKARKNESAVDIASSLTCSASIERQRGSAQAQ